MRLLVTRPREDADRFAKALTERGHEAVISPLLTVESRQETVDLAGVGALIFTSVNGLRAFAANSTERSLPVYAVGDRTATAAQAAGFTDVRSAAGDVEALSAKIAATWQPSAGTLLHAAGVRTAGDLTGQLEAAGFSLRRKVLYEARPAETLPEAARTALQSGKVDAVAFFSPRTAGTFVRLVRASGLERSTHGLSAVCLSPAVATEAKALIWADVRVAAQPTEAALLATLGSSRQAGQQTGQEDAGMAQDSDKPRKDTVSETKPEAESKAETAAGNSKAASATPVDTGPAKEAVKGAAPAAAGPAKQSAKPATGSATTSMTESAGDSAAEQVIARFGGLRPTATKLGVAVSTVQGWKARGHVPETRHEELRSAAAAHNIDISDIDLTAQESASADKQTGDATKTTVNPWAIPAEGGKQADTGSTPASAAARERSTTVSSAAGKTTDEEAVAERQDEDRDFREMEHEDERDHVEPGERHDTAPTASRGGGIFLGLVLAILLFVGGAVGAVFTRTYWEPYLPAGPADSLQTDLDVLSDRVASLESAPPPADPARLDALSQQLDELTQEVAQQAGSAPSDSVDSEALADLDRRIAVLAAQVRETTTAADRESAAPAAPSVDPAMVSGLENRVGELQSALEELRGAVAENSNATATAAAAAAEAANADAAALSGLESQLGDLQGQLEQVQQQAQQALNASAGDSGLALALGQLRDALRFSAPFEVELAAVQRLIPEGDPLLELLEPLAAHAVSGVPTRDELAMRFEPMAKDAVAASYDDSWSGRLMSRVSGAVSVRPVGEVEGDSPRARIARADARLANEDLSGAIQALSGMEGAAAAVAEPWLTDANARLTGEQALGELTRRTLARLTPAASPATE